MKRSYYEVSIDHYSGPSRETCTTARAIRPLIKRMRNSIFGGQSIPMVHKVTIITEDISKDYQ